MEEKKLVELTEDTKKELEAFLGNSEPILDKSFKKSKRGGARAGAGRPKNSIRRSQYNMHVSADEKAYIVNKLQQYRCAATNEGFVKLVVKIDKLLTNQQGSEADYLCVAMVGNDAYKVQPLLNLDKGYNERYYIHQGAIETLEGLKPVESEIARYMIMDVEK